jgi:hypothetical protein
MSLFVAKAGAGLTSKIVGIVALSTLAATFGAGKVYAQERQNQPRQEQRQEEKQVEIKLPSDYIFEFVPVYDGALNGAAKDAYKAIHGEAKTLGGDAVQDLKDARGRYASAGRDARKGGREIKEGTVDTGRGLGHVGKATEKKFREGVAGGSRGFSKGVDKFADWVDPRDIKTMVLVYRGTPDCTPTSTGACYTTPGQELGVARTDFAKGRRELRAGARDLAAAGGNAVVGTLDVGKAIGQGGAAGTVEIVGDTVYITIEGARFAGDTALVGTGIVSETAEEVIGGAILLGDAAQLGTRLGVADLSRLAGKGGVALNNVSTPNDQDAIQLVFKGGPKQAQKFVHDNPDLLKLLDADSLAQLLKYAKITK